MRTNTRTTRTALAAVATLALALGAAAWVFQDHVEPTLELILEGVLGR